MSPNRISRRSLFGLIAAAPLALAGKRATAAPPPQWRPSPQGEYEYIEVVFGEPELITRRFEIDEIVTAFEIEPPEALAFIEKLANRPDVAALIHERMTRYRNSLNEIMKLPPEQVPTGPVEDIHFSWVRQ